MARSTGRQFTLEIVADASKANKTFGALGKTLGGIGVALGAREVFTFLADSVTAASDLAESINAVERALPGAAIELGKLSTDAARRFGLSAKDFNEAAVGLAAFAERINQGDVAGTIESLTGRATDFASVMNLEVQDALRIFQSGLAGEAEPLRRFGIDISAAATSSFAYASGIAEAGQKLTETEKVQARFGLLLEQTARYQGDFADTSESAANAQRILRAELENARAELGTNLLPAYESFLQTMLDLSPAINNALSEVGELAEAQGKAVREGNILERTVGNVGVVLGTLISPLDAAKDALGRVFETPPTFKDFADTSKIIEDSLREATNISRDLTQLEEQQLDIWELKRLESQRWLDELRDDWATAERRIRAYNDALREQRELRDILGGGTTVAPPSFSPTALSAPQTIVNVSGVVGDPVSVGRQLAETIDTYQGFV